jgi:hypothetical protein
MPVIVRSYVAAGIAVAGASLWLAATHDTTAVPPRRPPYSRRFGPPDQIRIDRDDGQPLDEEGTRDVLTPQIDAMPQRLTEMKLMSACNHASAVDHRRRASRAFLNLVDSKRLWTRYRLHRPRTLPPQNLPMSAP